MHIALCTETIYPMYGVERLVYETAKRLKDCGIDVTLYTSTNKKQFPDLKIVQISNPTIINPPKRNYATCAQFSANLFLKLMKTECDIIDARGHLSLFPCSMAATATGKASVGAIYDVYASQWRDMYKGAMSIFGPLFEQMSFRAPFDKIIVINSSNRNQLIKDFGTVPEKIVVLPHALDMKYLDKVSKKQKRKKRILFAGRLAPQKNVFLLIKAYANLPENIKNRYELRIIGAGSESVLLKKLANGVGGEINFLGNIPDHKGVLKEMAAAEIFVVPSLRESLCIAALEAMACRTPVISTATDGPRDYIKNGLNGFLVPINDEAALTKKITELLSDEKLRNNMAKNARKTAEDHDFNKGVKKLIKIYENAIEFH